MPRYNPPAFKHCIEPTDKRLLITINHLRLLMEPSLLLPILAVVAGLILLMISADVFIEHAAAIAACLGMPPLLIGLTIVALGTSAPEAVVALFAAADGANDLAAGNVIGSNIANIGLVLGITGLISALSVNRQSITFDLPILWAASAFAGYMIFDNHMSRLEGLMLLAGFAVFLALLFTKNRVEPQTQDNEETQTHLLKSCLLFVLGLAVLLGSAQLLVWGATSVAKACGVSELVIGLTIVAVGTSLPELAASIASVRKGMHDIAFGNIIGSNIFNILLVLAIPAIVSSPTIESNVFHRDYIAMLVLLAALSLFMLLSFYRHKPFSKMMGGVLLCLYCCYYFILYQQMSA